jgi:hypothetical protein
LVSGRNVYQIEIPIGALNPLALPRICPVTGATDDLETRAVEFSWYPRWVNLLLVVGILFAVIAAAVTTRRAKGKMLFGRRVWFKWKLMQAMFVLSIFVAVLGLVFGAVALDEMAVLGWVIIVTSLLTPVALWGWLVRRRGVSVVLITDDRLILKIPNEQAALAYRAKFGGGTPVKLSASTAAMDELVARTTYAPDRSLCAVHEGTQAPWACGRCGSFFCPVCARYPVPGRNPLCAKCAER